MPTHCIVRNCTLHSVDKQQTFNSEGGRSHHWNKFHRDILCCLVDSDSDLEDTNNQYLDFLGLVACPVDGCNYVCFDDGLAHWNDAHSKGTPIDSKMEESGAVEKRGW